MNKMRLHKRKAASLSPKSKRAKANCSRTCLDLHYVKSLKEAKQETTKFLKAAQLSSEKTSNRNNG